MPITSTCRHCGKSFSYSPSRARLYCCRACHDADKAYTIVKTCPTCGKEFRNQKHPNTEYCSMDCFVASRHEQAICVGCGKHYERAMHRARKGTHRYCSRECAYKHQPYQPVTQREKRTCQKCGNEFETWKSRTSQYCSRRCAWDAKQVPDATVTRNCDECGQPYQVGRFFVTKRHSRFCSIECRSAFQSRTKRGAGNVNYRGGSVEYRGANWRRQARKTVKRDGYRCQICRKKVGLKRHDYGVHHIKPYREFNGDFETANQMNNLITLCVSCHTRVEAGKLACPVPLL